MISRNDIISRAIRECLNEMYSRAQPSTSFDELEKNIRHFPNKNWYDYFYLSQKESEEIIEDFIIAYRIKNEFHDDVDVVRTYLRDGGTKDKYIIPEDGGPGHRGYEKTPKISDLIGEESAQLILNLIDECDNFYQPNTEESAFRFNVMNYSPCCNIDLVRKNRPGINIYERVYDTEYDEWREIDNNGKFIYDEESENENY